MVVEPPFWVRADRRCVLHRVIDDAQQEEPRPGGAGPWARRPRHRGADRDARRIKGLPLAYQRDLQESVAPLFDAVAVYEASLGVMAGLVSTLRVDPVRMREAATEGYTTATAVADALVRRGVAFRTAHHIVGSLVAMAEDEGIGLDEVPDSMIGLALGASGSRPQPRLPRIRRVATRSVPRPRWKAPRLDGCDRRHRPRARGSRTRGGKGAPPRLIGTRLSRRCAAATRRSIRYARRLWCGRRAPHLLGGLR